MDGRTDPNYRKASLLKKSKNMKMSKKCVERKVGFIIEHFAKSISQIQNDCRFTSLYIFKGREWSGDIELKITLVPKVFITVLFYSLVLKLWTLLKVVVFSLFNHLNSSNKGDRLFLPPCLISLRGLSLQGLYVSCLTLLGYPIFNVT